MIDYLRQRIQAIERHEHKIHKVYPFGVEAIDNALPEGGLTDGHIHEFVATNIGATIGFCATILARIAKERGPIVWCVNEQDLHTPGLSFFGINPDDIIFIKTKSPRENLFIIEEALRTPCLGAIVSEISWTTIKTARRLQLAASKNGVTLFLLTTNKYYHTSFTATRWQVSPQASTLAPGRFSYDGIGAPRFLLKLIRCSGGITPLLWDIEWNEKALCFNIYSEPIEEQREIVRYSNMG